MSSKVEIVRSQTETGIDFGEPEAIKRERERAALGRFQFEIHRSKECLFFMS